MGGEPCHTVFITGTDTGVGKTIFTALLLAALRQSKNVHAVALKPFCSGDRSDALLLNEVQGHELPLDELNPFHFAQPLAPFVCAESEGRFISKAQALTAILRMEDHLNKSSSSSTKDKVLLIEGSGGLLAPLGAEPPNHRATTRAKPFTALDLMRALDCSAVVVAANRLGTLNHTLLTLKALQDANVPVAAVVLSETGKPPAKETDVLRRTNFEVLQRLISPVPLFKLDHIEGLSAARSTARQAAILEKGSREKQLLKIAASIISPQP